MSDFIDHLEKDYPDSSAASWYAGLVALSASLFAMDRHKNFFEFLFILDYFPQIEILFTGGIFFFLGAIVCQATVSLTRDLFEKNTTDATLINSPRVAAALGSTCLMAASVWIFVLAFMVDNHSEWAQPEGKMEKDVFSAMWATVFTVSAVTFYWNVNKIGETLWPSRHNKPSYH